jgi:hypothetical protein
MDKQTIEMPVSMRINVLKNGLITLINTSNLPPYIVEPIIKDLHMEVHELAEAQAKKEAEEYNKTVEESNNDGEPIE